MILAPLTAGLASLGLKSDHYRKLLVMVTVALVGGCSLALTGWHYPSSQITLGVDLHVVNLAMMVIEAVMALYVIWVGILARRPMIVALAAVQTILILAFEIRHGAVEAAGTSNLIVDKFSIIMALINGLVGGVICLYALGYMREFHEVHHPEIRDRRNVFFALLLVFQAAMFGVVFANNLLWLFFFWEVTTLCSFLLIGYKQDEQSKENSLRALVMNLSGGLAFAVGIVWFHSRTGSIEMSQFIKSNPQLVLGPAALLCFAGITKSAQFPFARWLLGAMVAPTPVSALLHSSTMVKAGVYLVVRLAPVLSNTAVGIVVALVGAVTFLIGSFAAIGANDAKKVLAYSTIANLGLIVLCGGIGSYEAVWAAILLIVFHAVAKCLLFLCVGVVEHKLHSRDIEAMSGLVIKMPRLSVMLQIGMAGMFLAPFGMLISKWAVLKAVVDTYPFLVGFIVFGSAATLFFWVKWMGKIIEVVGPQENVEKNIGFGEWLALYSLSILTFGTCLFFPMISSAFIEPYVIEVYGKTATMAQGNFVIMAIMLAMITLFPLSFLNYGRGVKVVDAYLGGANIESSVRFLGSAGQEQNMVMKNYYFNDVLAEPRLLRFGLLLGTSLLVLLMGVALL